MMILIWDNGMDYSSHDIDFIELGDVSTDDAVALLRMHDERGYVIGLAERVEWRQSAVGQLFDFVSPWFDLSKAGDVPRELCLRLLDYEDKRLRALIEENNKRTCEKWVNENLNRSLLDLADARAAVEARQ